MNEEKRIIKNIDFNIDLAQSFGIYKNNSEYDKILGLFCYRITKNPVLMMNSDNTVYK